MFQNIFWSPHIFLFLKCEQKCKVLGDVTKMSKQTLNHNRGIYLYEN